MSPQALQDLADVQARVVERNKKLEDLENRDSSLKDAAHDEVVQLRSQLKDARNELRDTLKDRNKILDEVEMEMDDLKKKMQKEKLDEILKGLFAKIRLQWLIPEVENLTVLFLLGRRLL
jgi:predicted RNase H-like nuclease (RuvC/YqgF family)